MTEYIKEIKMIIIHISTTLNENKKISLTL